MSSLYRRLLAWLLGSLGVLWLAVGFSVYVTVRTSLEGRFDTELRAMASEVRHLFVESGQPPLAKTAGLWFDFFQKDSGVYFEVWDEFRLFSDRSPSLGSTGLPQPAAFAEAPHFWNFTLPSGEKVRGIAQQFLLPPYLHAGGGEAHPIHVVAARNRDHLDQSLGLLLGATGLVGLLMIPVSFLIVGVAVGRGLRPLRTFAERASSFGFGSLAERFQTDGVPRELLPISLRLNELMDRLEAGVERERRLNADLAHELRTPVTELKTMAEVALAWPEKITAESYQGVLGAAKQMQSIIEGMLLLARWDRNPVRPALEEVHIEEIVRRCWQPHAEAAAAKRLHGQRRIESGTVLRTSPDLFQIILSNLFANAVEYSPEAGTVALDCRTINGRFHLSVTNSCSSLKPADMPHLFERFWRRDAARSGSGHAGLGLALARSCANLLDLDLSATLDEPAKSITFRVTAPLSHGS